MTTDEPEDRLKQTTPEGTERERLGLPGEGGTEIPVPSRRQVMRDFERLAIATPDERKRPRRRGKGDAK